ncbi:helix-turn-helix domain-containing protein [Flavobacterium microcysteis]|uniref:AraC family transcriptional regulator n=1 Tax=Flavobacterium microcysteis TaxID=2596891 RepID=A0A501QDU7_9FLAO|nr:helix-turn-helix domain-containing protein [Flavobacterium microcysteis]TPD70544.1 AraC family transcriptional regulator [Flavobacterium microcysteis]
MMYIDRLIVIFLLGGFALLTMLVLFNPLKVNKKANIWLGLFLFLWGTFWVDEALDILGIQTVSRSFSFVLSFLQFFTPLTFYYSVVYFTNPTFSFSLKEAKHLPLAFLFLVLLSLSFFYDKVDKNSLTTWLTVIMLIQSLFYALYSCEMINRHQKKIQQFSSDTYPISLNWLKYIAYTILGSGIIITIYNIIFTAERPSTYMNFAFLIAIYFIAYYSLKQEEVYPTEPQQAESVFSLDEENKTSEPQKFRLLSEEETELIKQKLLVIMESEAPYLDGDLNLIKLAKLMGVTPHQLSYVINTGFNENFFQFINKYRIEKAKQLLGDSKNNNLSILGIAFESGFNSKTSFNITFKKFTDLTPSEFKKKSSNL